ncbi:MAG TPA: sigma-70 family RNA polymerase sigma factor [Terriglobales bacterium]|nr:sigma-70 family RNA polymerase sigma factor [Terriglobales bacterium]
MAATSGPSVTELLARWSGGDLSAREALVPLIYEELRRIARRCLAGRDASHTLQPTALVHEAYLRLANRDSLTVRDRVHFYAMAAQMMRQILIDHARKENAAKRGGMAVTISIDQSADQPSVEAADLDLLALDRAMKQLALLDERQCRIVELRFFGGLSIEETAEMVEISQATAKREWATARIWLHRNMTGGPATP